MKSFLDRFRRKGSDEDEADRKTESARDLADQALQKRAAAAAARAEGKGEGKPATKEAVNGPGQTPETAQVSPSKDETITFTLGDFVNRIPAQLLTSTEHDSAAPLTFDVADLSARIARGQTTIPLSEIYKRLPQIFRGEIRESDNIEIRFPWQKLLELVKAANTPNPKPGLTESAAEALAQKLRTRKRNVGSSGAPPTGGGGERGASRFPGTPRQPSWFSRPTPLGPGLEPTGPVHPVEVSVTPAGEAEAASAEAAPAQEEPAKAAIPSPELVQTTISFPPSESQPAPAASEQAIAREIERICESTDQQVAAIRSEHEQAVNALRKENEQLAEQRDRAMADLEKSRRQLEEQTKSAINAARADNVSVNSEVEALRAGLEAKSQEIKALQAQLDEHRVLSGTELESLEKQRDQQRQAHQAREQEFAALQAEANRRDKELETLRQRLQQAENAARIAAEERAADHAALEAHAQELETLRAEAAGKQKQLNRDQLQLEQLQHSSDAGLAAVTAERDRFRAEAEARRTELQAIQKRFDQLSHAAKAELQEVDSERERLRKEFEALATSLSAAQADLDSFKLAAASEREASETQKRHLAEQIATLQKAEHMRAEAHATEGERSRREGQRHAEELHRRILALETTQKEVAQELSREREMRIKAERTAASADRARSEAAALVESIRNETRREAETNARRRDSEFARAQKELQDRIDQLSETASKLKAERDELHSEVTQLKEASAVAAAAPGEWENRAVATLEEDIENYRNRLKSVLKERDGLLKERDEAAAAHSSAKSELATLNTAREGLLAESKELQDERARLTTQVGALEQRLAESEQKLSAQRDANLKELNQAREESAAALHRLQEELKGAAAARTTLEQNAAGLAHERDAARKQIESLQARVEELSKRPQADPKQEEELRHLKAALTAAEKSANEAKEHAAATAEELRRQRDEFTVELGQVREKHAAELQQIHDAAAEPVNALNRKLAALEGTRAELETQLTAANKQRDAARKRIEKLQADVDELAARPQVDPAREEEFARLKAALISAEETAAAAKQHATGTAEEFAKHRAELTREIDHLKQSHAAELETLRQNAMAPINMLNEKIAALENARGELQTQLAAATQQRDAARKRVEKLQRDLDETLEQPRTDPAEVTRIQEALKAAQQELTSAREEAAAASEQLEAQRAELNRELSASRELHAREVQKLREEAVAATAALNEKLAALEKSHTGVCAELLQAKQERDAARKRAEKLQHDLDEAHRKPAVDPAVVAEVEQLRSQLAEAQQKANSAAAESERLEAAARAQLDKERHSHELELQRIREDASAAAEKHQQELSSILGTKGAVEQSLAHLRREHEASTETLKSLTEKLQAAEAALTAKDNELARAKADTDAARNAAAADAQQAMEAIRGERDELAAELSATRERARTLLSSNEKEHRAALASATEERDAARRDSAALAQRIAELRLEAEQRSAQHQHGMDHLKAELEKLAGETARNRQAAEQQSAAFARELKAITDERDKAVAAAEQARRELQEKTSGAEATRAHAEKLTAERITRLEREVSRMKRERDQLIEQRDELRDRIEGMVEAQQRIVKEIALQATKTAPLPTDVVQKKREPRETRETRESNVIDISGAEVLQPHEPDSSGVRPPRLRPVVIPPPNVRVL